MYFQRVFVLFLGEITILLIQMGYLHLIAEKTSDCSLVSDSSTPLGQNCDVPDAANLNCVQDILKLIEDLEAPNWCKFLCS